MKELESHEIEFVSGGGEDVWYNIGYAVGSAYASAVSATTEFLCWINGVE